MIHKTTGIVLHSIRYGETSVIARVSTRELGIQSCLTPGVRKSRARVKYNLFQPLTPVDLVIYSKERGGLSRVREISCPEPLKSIHCHVPLGNDGQVFQGTGSQSGFV